MKLVLFHDDLALRWTPFVETRPIGELLFGAMTLRERAARALGAGETVYLGPAALEGLDEPDTPPVVSRVPDDADRVYLCARAVLDLPEPFSAPRAPTRLTTGERTIGWLVPAGASAPEPRALRTLADAGGPAVEVPGELLERPWHLMARNAARITADAERAIGSPDAPAGVHRLGDKRLVLGPGAEIEPGVVLDLRHGPIWLAAGVRAEGPGRLTGPLYVGPGTTLLGGCIGLSSIGPVCKVRGELTDSVLNGWCNKAHDGHLGHAVLGRWVNLGAGTINSDLKNTYSPIRLRVPEGDLDTGLLKVGCFLGDHVKTGIGTLITTGAVFGTGANVFGGVMPPACVPPFSWGSGEELVEYDIERFLATAATAMARRKVELGPGVRQVLRRAFEASADERARRGMRS
jgi:UDP-N-acetylglucosamine diphosphorylase/glucosamine-1-phosphate N-acetyltransferase